MALVGQPPTASNASTACLRPATLKELDCPRLNISTVHAPRSQRRISCNRLSRPRSGNRSASSPSRAINSSSRSGRGNSAPSTASGPSPCKPGARCSHSDSPDASSRRLCAGSTAFCDGILQRLIFHLAEDQRQSAPGRRTVCIPELVAIKADLRICDLSRVVFMERFADLRMR